MYKMITKEELANLKSNYPAGTMVELVKMDDPQAPPKGTRGMIIGVDDIGSLLVNWDNGSRLNVIYREDIVQKVSQGELNHD